MADVSAILDYGSETWDTMPFYINKVQPQLQVIKKSH